MVVKAPHCVVAVDVSMSCGPALEDMKGGKCVDAARLLSQTKVMLLLRRRCLQRPPHLFALLSKHSRRFALDSSTKSEATAAYEQLLREHAPIITYLDKSTVGSVPLVPFLPYTQ